MSIASFSLRFLGRERGGLPNSVTDYTKWGVLGGPMLNDPRVRGVALGFQHPRTLWPLQPGPAKPVIFLFTAGVLSFYDAASLTTQQRQYARLNIPH